MRFKIPSLLSNFKYDQITDSEHSISAHEESTVSRGEQSSFRQFIQQLRLIVGDDQLDETLVMVQMDQQAGNMAISLIKKNNRQVQQVRPVRITNQSSTAAAIEEYQKELEKSILTIKSRIEEVKRNRMFYNRYLQESREKSIINQANNLIINLIQLCPVQITQMKPRTASEDTTHTNSPDLKQTEKEKNEETENLIKEDQCQNCFQDWFGAGLNLEG